MVWKCPFPRSASLLLLGQDFRALGDHLLDGPPLRPKLLFKHASMHAANEGLVVSEFPSQGSPPPRTPKPGWIESPCRLVYTDKACHRRGKLPNQSV